MQNPEPENDSPTVDPPAWQPLPPHLRRVAGVLVEKAKTTPSAYPLSLNAVKTGCNQKSNR
ncbi:MAG: YceH family protein, partial [Planctomycetota bacterium]|nr:YceH family protein [Planctomycetota bacterium]